MSRCLVCKHWIWPWSRRGFYVASALLLAWHPACAKRLPAVLHELQLEAMRLERDVLGRLSA